MPAYSNGDWLLPADTQPERYVRSVERADLHTILQEQCADLVIDREIHCGYLRRRTARCTAGFIHPTLYLPDGTFPGQTRRSFSIRADALQAWRSVAQPVASGGTLPLHWFNPLVHLIARFSAEAMRRRATTRLFADTTARTAELWRDHPAVGYRREQRERRVSCFGDDKKTLMRRFEDCLTGRSKNAVSRSL